MKSLLLLIAFILTSAFAPVPVLASVLITFDLPAQSGGPGDTLVFNGVITNQDPVFTVYLNTFSVNLAGDDFTTDGMDPFFAFVPVSLAGGASSGDIELFSVSINDPLIDPLGVYPGTYTLVGGANPPTIDNPNGSQDNLGSADFTVETTPEPGTLALLGAGILALMLCAYARTRAVAAS